MMPIANAISNAWKLALTEPGNRHDQEKIANRLLILLFGQIGTVPLILLALDIVTDAPTALNVLYPIALYFFIFIFLYYKRHAPTLTIINATPLIVIIMGLFGTFLNGYLANLSHPLFVIISVLAYRGKWRYVVPFCIVAALGFVLYLSEAPQAWDFSARTLVVAAFIVIPINYLLDKQTLDESTRFNLLIIFYLHFLVILIIFGLANFFKGSFPIGMIAGALITSALIALLIFAKNWKNLNTTFQLLGWLLIILNLIAGYRFGLQSIFLYPIIFIFAFITLSRAQAITISLITLAAAAIHYVGFDSSEIDKHALFIRYITINIILISFLSMLISDLEGHKTRLADIDVSIPQLLLVTLSAFITFLTMMTAPALLTIDGVHWASLFQHNIQLLIVNTAISIALTWLGVNFWLQWLENKRIYQKLTIKNQAVLDSAAQQNKVFAIVGHELRTPISILKQLADEMDIKHMDMHGTTFDTVMNHTLTVLDDMRAVNNIEFVIQSKPSLSSLAECLEGAVEAVNNITDEHQLTVSVLAPKENISEFYFNARLVSQITMNLTKNAAYYSQGSELVIQPRVLNETEDELTIAIVFSDNGKGISDKLKATLFSAYERGESNKDGTGLGLHLSQQYAQKYLKGDLRLKESEHGACFELIICGNKANQQTAAAAAAAAAEHISLNNMSILLAEDNATIRMTTELLLSREGAIVTCAEDGQVAFDAASHGTFDLVLTDYFMPNMDGDELIKSLRASGFDKPIIAVTAATVGDEIDKLLVSGANAVLMKPLSIADIKDALTATSKLSSKQSRQPHKASLSVNWERIDNIFKGNNKTLHPLLEEVCQDVGGVFSSLSTSATIDRETAHRIKGSCLNIGFEKLAEYFSQVEQVVKQQQPLPESLINAIQEELVQVRQTVEQRITDSATQH